jgi:methylenetetrahydrofolate dehydrogenase (NADP+)/methenyltetrahydrofolate cyclohydrolase
MRTAALKSRGVTPGLAVIVVGENPASRTYVSNKARACAEVGVHSEVHHLPSDASEETVLTTLHRLNADQRIHGVIVQLPLPTKLRTQHILQQVAIEKDVDGFNWCNQGALADGHPRFVPCTPLGVVTLLERSDVEIEGRRAVVVGRSSIVGKPLAMLLLARNATVTICHSKTRDLQFQTSQADILVAAAGSPGLITKEMVRDGAAVIDVGINRLADGRLTGDVDYIAVMEKASLITPVPGGVGPMTVAMLIANTVTAAELATASR